MSPTEDEGWHLPDEVAGGTRRRKWDGVSLLHFASAPAAASVPIKVWNQAAPRRDIEAALSQQRTTHSVKYSSFFPFRKRPELNGKTFVTHGKTLTRRFM